jgi:hypothetical protein
VGQLELGEQPADVGLVQAEVALARALSSTTCCRVQHDLRRRCSAKAASAAARSGPPGRDAHGERREAPGTGAGTGPEDALDRLTG